MNTLEEHRDPGAGKPEIKVISPIPFVAAEGVEAGLVQHLLNVTHSLALTPKETIAVHCVEPFIVVPYANFYTAPSFVEM